jgi:hypothetical protein
MYDNGTTQLWKLDALTLYVLYPQMETNDSLFVA